MSEGAECAGDKPTGMVDTDPMSFKCCPSFGISPCCCAGESSYRGKFKYQNRGCTDIPCLIIFYASIVCLAIILAVASADGNVLRVIYGTDYAHNLCGDSSATNYDPSLLNGSWSEYRYLWYPLDIDVFTDAASSVANSYKELSLTDSLSIGVCVKECPSVSLLAPELADVIPPFTDAQLALLPTVTTYDKSGVHSFPVYYDSTPVLRRCAPAAIFNTQLASKISGKIVELGDQIGVNSFVMEGLGEVHNAWKAIVVCVAIGFILSFVWLIIMKYLTKPIVFLTLVLLQILLVAIGLIFYYRYLLVLDYQNSSKITLEPSPTPNAIAALADASSKSLLYQASNVEASWDRVYLGFAITFWVLAGIYFFFFIFMLRRILIACDIIEEALDLVATSPTLLLVPITKFVMVLGLAAFHVYLGLLIYTIVNFSNTNGFLASDPLGGINDSVPINSTGIAEVDNKIASIKTAFTGINVTDLTISDSQVSKVKAGLSVANLFMFLWNFGFVNAFGFMIISMFTAMWWWSAPTGHPKKSNSIFKAWWWVTYYHQGTIAFGSLLIAIVQLARIIMVWVEEKLKKVEGEGVKCIVWCISCLLMCLEHVLKFINHNAYVMTAISGKWFCTAASSALGAVIGALLQIAAISFISDAVLALTKVFIVASVGVIAWFLMGTSQLAVSVNYRVIPLVIACFGTYIVASVFIGLVEAVVMTLRLAFVLEQDQVEDTDAKIVTYMPEDLARWTNAHVYSKDKVQSRGFCSSSKVEPEPAELRDSPSTSA